MCDYQAGTWECRGDGYLWDADSDGLDSNDHTYPCPKCNPKIFLANSGGLLATMKYETVDFTRNLSHSNNSVDFAK